MTHTDTQLALAFLATVAVDDRPTRKVQCTFEMTEGNLLDATRFIDALEEWTRTQGVRVTKAHTLRPDVTEDRRQAAVAAGHRAPGVSLTPQGECVWVNTAWPLALPGWVVVKWSDPVPMETYIEVAPGLCVHSQTSPCLSVLRQRDGMFRFRVAMSEGAYKELTAPTDPPEGSTSTCPTGV